MPWNTRTWVDALEYEDLGGCLGIRVVVWTWVDALEYEDLGGL